MGIETSIERTIARLNDIAYFTFGDWARRLYAGLSKEFGRVSEYKDKVLCATVPSESLCIEALDDLEKKYGISYLGDVTEQDRINRIVERASLFGSLGPGWLQQQIQAAGFPLYVIENTPQVQIETQYGDDLQHDTSTQYAMMPKRIDPTTVPGVLITSSPNKRGARRVVAASQYGTQTQYSDGFYSTPDDRYSYPQPAIRQLPTDPTKWGRVFFLSPFPDRLATDDEMLLMGDEHIRYLEKLVIQIKALRNWCIAQVYTQVIMIDDIGEVLTWDDDSVWEA
jgi:uncharacterized protein YmfQ (DUF2313 family)